MYNLKIVPGECLLHVLHDAVLLGVDEALQSHPADICNIKRKFGYKLS